MHFQQFVCAQSSPPLLIPVGRVETFSPVTPVVGRRLRGRWSTATWCDAPCETAVLGAMADSGFKPSSKRSVGESLKASFTDDPVARKVLKATDSSDNPPKEKHLEGEKPL